MLKRVLTTIFGIPLLILFSFIFHGLPYVITIGLLALVGLNEFYSTIENKTDIRPQKIIGTITVIFLGVSSWYKVNGEILVGVLTVLIIISFIIEMKRDLTSPIKNLGTTIFGAIYVGWLFTFLIIFRHDNKTIPVSLIPGEYQRGAWLVLYIYFTTWACDAGALFIGRSFGRNKLAPKLSPNKTIEGSIGGIIGALVLSIAFGSWIGLPFKHLIVLGLITGIFGQIGDLCESLLKRDLGVKDFGSFFPGHGGVLDRFDSLLITAPLAYYYLKIVMRLF